MNRRQARKVLARSSWLVLNDRDPAHRKSTLERAARKTNGIRFETFVLLVTTKLIQLRLELRERLLGRINAELFE